MATHRVSLQELERILPARQVSELAVKYGVDARNQHRLPGMTVFTCLLDSIINHGVTTQRLLEEIHFQRTGTTADHSSFGQRLTSISAAFFEAIYQDVHTRLAPQASAAEQRALRVRRADATVVTLSSKLLLWGLKSGTRKGKGTWRQVKTVLSLEDDGVPQLLRICENPSENSDSVAMGDAMLTHARPGDLWVFDKGCHSRLRLLKLHEKQTFWLTPHGTQALRECETIWQVPETTLPTAAPEEGDPAFVLQRVERAYFGNRNETQGEWGSMPLLFLHGLRWDTRKSVWKPMVLMTNLPLRPDSEGAGPFTWAEVADVYRQRWEIEVLFKFLKQHLGYAHLTSRSENGIRIMVYMALIAALLLIWYKRLTGIDRGWRSVRVWFAHDLRAWVEGALRIAFAVPEPEPQT
jgi:Transposase DDE domain